MKEPRNTDIWNALNHYQKRCHFSLVHHSIWQPHISFINKDKTKSFIFWSTLTVYQPNSFCHIINWPPLHVNNVILSTQCHSIYSILVLGTDSDTTKTIYPTKRKGLCLTLHPSNFKVVVNKKLVPLLFFKIFKFKQCTNGGYYLINLGDGSTLSFW